MSLRNLCVVSFYPGMCIVFLRQEEEYQILWQVEILKQHSPVIPSTAEMVRIYQERGGTLTSEHCLAGILSKDMSSYNKSETMIFVSAFRAWRLCLRTRYMAIDSYLEMPYTISFATQPFFLDFHSWLSNCLSHSHNLVVALAIIVLS